MIINGVVSDVVNRVLGSFFLAVAVLAATLQIIG